MLSFGPFLVFRFDKIRSMDLHTKGLEESFVYEISDLDLSIDEMVGA